MALHWFGEYISSFCSSQSLFFWGGFISGSGIGCQVIRQLVIDACRCCEAPRNQTKPNGLHLSV